MGLDLISLLRAEPSLQPLRTHDSRRAVGVWSSAESGWKETSAPSSRCPSSVSTLLVGISSTNLRSQPNLSNLRFGVDGKEGRGGGKLGKNSVGNSLLDCRSRSFVRWACAAGEPHVWGSGEKQLIRIFHHPFLESQRQFLPLFWVISRLLIVAPAQHFFSE